jgi:hypothetical protein
VNKFRPWPIPIKPTLQVFEGTIASTGERRPLVSDGDHIIGDHIIVRGRLLVENGHPQNISNGAGDVFLEMHPIDWLTIRIAELPQPADVVHRSLIAIAPLKGKITTGGALWINDDGSGYQRVCYPGLQVQAPPRPAGLDPSITTPRFTETVHINGTGLPLEQVRNIFPMTTGILVQVPPIAAPIIGYLGNNNIPYGDDNDPSNGKSVLHIDYAVYWESDTTTVKDFGHLRHALRAPDGSWNGFNDMSSSVGGLGGVCAIAATAAIPGEAQYVALDADGHLWHALRQVDGSWLGFNYLAASAGDIGQAYAVSAARTDSTGEVQVLALTMGGDMHLAVRRADASWDPFMLIGGLHGGPAGGPEILGMDAFGGCMAIASATGGGGEVHHFLVSQDGNFHVWLWHAIRAATGDWIQQFKQLSANTDLLHVTRLLAAASGPNGEIQLVAITGDGGLFHALRDTNGNWNGFNEMKGPAGDPGLAVYAAGATGANDEVQWAVSNSQGQVFHTIRTPDGNWTPFADVSGPARDPGVVCRVAAANSGAAGVQFTTLDV